MQLKTELKNRTLWYDGTVETTPDQVWELFLRGIDASKIVVTATDDDVELFNSIEDVPLSSMKCTNETLNLDWIIPKKYNELKIHDIIIDKLYFFLKDIPEEKHLQYVTRVELELEEINNRGLQNLFKTLVYVTDTLRDNNIVWGVGRGSSCACFCLFLIGVHLIDPVKFGIPLEEFFHD